MQICKVYKSIKIPGGKILHNLHKIWTTDLNCVFTKDERGYLQSHQMYEKVYNLVSK